MKTHPIVRNARYLPGMLAATMVLVFAAFSAQQLLSGRPEQVTSVATAYIYLPSSDGSGSWLDGAAIGESVDLETYPADAELWVEVSTTATGIAAVDFREFGFTLGPHEMSVTPQCSADGEPLADCELPLVLSAGATQDFWLRVSPEIIDLLVCRRLTDDGALQPFVVASKIQYKLSEVTSVEPSRSTDCAPASP